VCVSCTEKLNSWNNWNGGGTNQNQNYNTSPAEDTDPSYSNVVIEDEQTSEDNVANTNFDAEIKIKFSQNGADITGTASDVSINKDGAHVTVTNAGDKKVKYTLSGESTDGCFKLYSNKKQEIVLKGLNLKNSKGPAINNQSKRRTFIVLQGTNTIEDGSVDSDGNYPQETDDEDMKATLFSDGQLIFSGSGSLEVNAIGKAGITSDDYIRFMTGCNINVNSAKGHGVRGKDAIIVSGGTVNVALASTATAKKCFTSDSLVYIGGGKITLENKASCGNVDSEMKGSACIKADEIFVIQGGELSVTASGTGCKCISGDKNGYFEGGKVFAKSSGSNYGSSSGRFGTSSTSVSSKAIKFDGNLEFSKSEVSASASAHEAIESKGTLYISGGSISATSSDDAINSALTMTISDGIVYAYSMGNDGLDANGNLIIKGGTVYAIGCGSPEVGIDANTEQGYKFYLQGGNVIAVGGIESGSSVSQNVISTSWTRNTNYSLCDGEECLISFKTPSSGGSGLFISTASLESGSKYSLISGASLSGATTCFDGILSIGGTASGGSSSSVSASTYTSNGGGMGGGFGPGGGFGW